MTSMNPSMFATPDSSSTTNIAAVNVTTPSPASVEPCRSLNGPVGILWDIENCPVPNDVRPEDVAGNIRMALRIHPVIKGAVTMFSAYGDFNIFPRRLREGCQRTGVKLVDVPNGRKDAADKAILVDMFLFALDNPPPSSILLISGDVDFSPALHILGQRGYTIILVIPDKVGVASALSNAGRFVWDWPSVARGEGFVPPKNCLYRGSELAGLLRGCHVGGSIDGPTLNEEESIVYTGGSQCPGIRGNASQSYCFTPTFPSRDASKGFCSAPDYGGNSMGTPAVTSARPQSIAREPPSVNHNQMHDAVLWVQPGDIQGLKAQLVRLLEMSGGSLPLVRVPPEYLRNYGRPLYIAEYGACKLVNLIRKMGSTFMVVGKGHNKMLCLQNAAYRYENASISMAKRDVKGKGNMDDGVNIGVCQNMGSSSDDFSDDEKADGTMEDGDDTTAVSASFNMEHHIQLERFRQEVQELLVCYSGRLLLSRFDALYEQRYKKPLNYRSYGVDKLEDLIAKISDIVSLHEDKVNKRKFLVSGSWGG